MDGCTHTSPIKDIQPKKRDFLCLGEHEFHETMRDEHFLIRGESHEFLPSGWYSCNSYAISKGNTPQGFDS